MKGIVSTVLLIVCTQYVLAGRDYSDFKIIKATPNDEKALLFLRNLEVTENYDNMDFLSKPMEAGRGVDIRVHSKQLLAMQKRFSRQGVQVEVMVDNVQTLIDNEARAHSLHNSPMTQSSGFNLTTYNSYDDIVSFLHTSCEDAVDSITCEVFKVGKTYEGRDLMAIKISLEERDVAADDDDEEISNDDDADSIDVEEGTGKPIMYIESGIHAREWIAPASVLHFINQIFTNADLRREILSRYDLYVMPSSNPDGYTYSREHERFWRKTRSPNANSACMGTDPNRNWDILWSGPGASEHPCSEVYQGTKAFSELETRAMADLMLSFKGRMKVYLAIHSYSQYWLVPYSYTFKVAKNFDDMYYAAREAAIVQTAVTGNNFTFGQTSRVFYLCAGGSDDWAKDVGKATYSYTVELQDQGRYGFALPASRIHRVGNGLTKAIEELAKAIERVEMGKSGN